MEDAGTDLAAAFAQASKHVRETAAVSTEHERAIRDVAVGVSLPALATFVIWAWRKAHRGGFDQVSFLSRDGQVLLELAQRLQLSGDWPARTTYAYSSRRTWSLAASNVAALSQERWLFNSFMRSSAADLCERLGLDYQSYVPALLDVGARLDPDARESDDAQRAAFERFLRLREVQAAVAARVDTMNDLVLDYARQEGLDRPQTLLVDAGWTGRMVTAFAQVLARARRRVPSAAFWALQPNPPKPPADICIEAFMYDSGRRTGMEYWLADTSFVIETFCMADHGVVTGYTRDGGGVRPTMRTHDNPTADDWGLPFYRRCLYEGCEVLAELQESLGADVGGDQVRSLVHTLLKAFWTDPTRAEARAWGRYVYDSDPTSSAARRLARALPKGSRNINARGDRAWWAGSLALR